MFVMHSKYMCPPKKVGGCGQLNVTFLIRKVLGAEIEGNTCFKDI